jgi:hypothetical protein
MITTTIIMLGVIGLAFAGIVRQKRRAYRHAYLDAMSLETLFSATTAAEPKLAQPRQQTVRHVAAQRKRLNRPRLVQSHAGMAVR